MHDGGIGACPFIRGAMGVEVLFIKVSQVISCFIRSNKFIAAIHAPRNFRMISIISGIIFEVNIVAEQKQA